MGNTREKECQQELQFEMLFQVAIEFLESFLLEALFHPP